jgi:type IV pilus assembly protein PilX
MKRCINHNCAYKKHHHQQGAILVVSLLILLVMTIIGVTSMRTTIFEERMAGNLRDRTLAVESAEAGLRFAEDYIAANIVSLGSFDSDGSDGLYDDTVPTNENTEIWEVVDWTGSDDGNNNEAIAADKLDGIGTAPKFVIQLYGSVAVEEDRTNLDNYGSGVGAGTLQMFLITVRGTGGSDNAVAILQSTYGKLL